MKKEKLKKCEKNRKKSVFCFLLNFEKIDPFFEFLQLLKRSPQLLQKLRAFFRKFDLWDKRTKKRKNPEIYEKMKNGSISRLIGRVFKRKSFCLRKNFGWKARIREEFNRKNVDFRNFCIKRVFFDFYQNFFNVKKTGFFEKNQILTKFQFFQIIYTIKFEFHAGLQRESRSEPRSFAFKPDFFDNPPRKKRKRTRRTEFLL